MAQDNPLDSSDDRADGTAVRDQRALVAVTVGTIGALVGAAGVIVDSTILGAVAGLAALCVGLLALSMHRGHKAQQVRISDLETRLGELEQQADDDHAQDHTDDLRGPTGPPLSALDRPRQTSAVPLPPSVAPDALTGPAPASSTSREADLLADPQTGLFSEGYFRVALDARISAARRHLRPVAVVILDVVQGLDTGHPTPSNPKLVAESIAATVRDADTACRMDDGRFALVLEDTPENGAIWTVERIRRRLAESAPGQTLWAGVACYPAHAFDSDEILAQTELALGAAREWRQDRIEVAVAP